MKALLLKDFYTLVRQMRIFVIIIIIFSVMPQTSIAAFAVVYSAMLPMTAIAYDESCKWDRLAVMMPYSVKNLVLEKYVLGYIMVIASSLLSILSEIVITMIKGERISMTSVVAIAAFVCVALIMQALNLPFIYRFGAEKGRFVYLAFFVLILSAASFFENGAVLVDKFSMVPLNSTVAIIILLLLTIVTNIASIFLSEKFYLKKSHILKQ